MEVVDAFAKLGRRVCEETVSALERNEVKKATVKKLRLNLKESEFEYVDSDIWCGVEQLLNRVIYTDEYREAREKLIQYFLRKPEVLNFYLYGFILHYPKRVVDKMRDGATASRTLDQYVPIVSETITQTFAREVITRVLGGERDCETKKLIDVANVLLDFNVKIEVSIDLSGVEVENNTSLSAVMIRSVRDEEFFINLESDVDLGGILTYAYATSVAPITAVAELKRISPTFPFLFIKALRLYKLCSVTDIGARLKALNYVYPYYLSQTHVQKPVYTCRIAPEEAEKLDKFITTFIEKAEPLLLDRRDKGFWVIALERYETALFAEDPAERLAYAVMGLEALYMKGGETQELKRRLSQRVAKAMSLLGLNPTKTYEDIDDAYDVRSKFVHGSRPDKLEEDLVKRVLEYLRLSLLLYLDLSREKVNLNRVKESFINILDKALIDPKYVNEMQVSLQMELVKYASQGET